MRKSKEDVTIRVLEILIAIHYAVYVALTLVIAYFSCCLNKPQYIICNILILVVMTFILARYAWRDGGERN